MSEKINPIEPDGKELASAPMVVNEVVSLSRRPIIELHDQIDRGDYKLILGDDASGRIPTLVWREFLGEVNALKSQPKPETLFLAGSKDLEATQMVQKIKEITEYLKKRKIKELFKDKRDRALIVTDTIQTGQSLLPLTHALANLGIRYEIMTNILIDELPQAIVESNLGAEIHFGDKRHKDMTTYAYQNTPVSGVTKNAEDLFANPVDLSDPSAGVSTHDILAESRDLIKPAAQQIFEYFSQLK